MLCGARSMAGVLILSLCSCAAAFAAEEYRTGPPFWYTLQGGAMFPSGRKGFGLERGPQAIGSIEYPIAPGLVLGGDLGVVSSQDLQRKRIIVLAMHGRLNPNPDLRPLYVQGGAGFYHVSYRPEIRTALTPANRTRPGLSFGVGYDFTDFTRVAWGVVGMYHGIVLARSAGLSYVTIGIYASLRPSIW
jgi:hypothetical protein